MWRKWGKRQDKQSEQNWERQTEKATLLAGSRQLSIPSRGDVHQQRGNNSTLGSGSEWYCNEPVSLALQQTPPTHTHLNQLPRPPSGSLHSVSSHFKRAWRALQACTRPGDRNICMRWEEGRRVSRGDTQCLGADVTRTWTAGRGRDAVRHIATGWETARPFLLHGDPLIQILPCRCPLLPPLTIKLGN